MFSNLNKRSRDSMQLGTNVIQELKINQRRILIDSLEIGIPAPEQIMSLCERELPNGSKVGQLFNSKTLNYKKFTPHRDGLFCERIFGPIQSFICACGKKKESVQNKGKEKDKRKILFCPKCEVEYVEKNVRRHRLGYIKLFSPVTHIWYLKGRPSYLSLILGKKKKGIISLAYCNAYLVEQADPQTSSRSARSAAPGAYKHSLYRSAAPGPGPGPGKNPSFVSKTPEFLLKSGHSNLSRQKMEDKSRKLTFLSNLMSTNLACVSNSTRVTELPHFTQSYGYSSENLVNKTYNNFNNYNTFHSKPFSHLLRPPLPETYVQNAFFDNVNYKKLIRTPFVKDQTVSTKNLPFENINTNLFSSKQEESKKYIQNLKPLKSFPLSVKASPLDKQNLYITNLSETRFYSSSSRRFKDLLPCFFKDFLHQKKDLSNQTLFRQQMGANVSKSKPGPGPGPGAADRVDLSKDLDLYPYKVGNTKAIALKNRAMQYARTSNMHIDFHNQSLSKKSPSFLNKPSYMSERTKAYAFYYKKVPFFVHDASQDNALQAYNEQNQKDSTLFQSEKKAYLIPGKNKIKTKKKLGYGKVLISQNLITNKDCISKHETPFTHLPGPGPGPGRGGPRGMQDSLAFKVATNKVDLKEKIKIRSLTKDVRQKRNKLSKTIDFSIRAKSGMTSSYIRAQTLPFLPSLICSFYLRDCLTSFLQSIPSSIDLPIPQYCQTPRRYPLRDVHKFIAEQRSTNATNKNERLTIKSIRQFTGFSHSISRQSKLIGVSNFSSVVHHFLRKSYLNSFQPFLDDIKDQKGNVIDRKDFISLQTKKSKLSFLSNKCSKVIQRKIAVVGYFGKNRMKSKNFIIAATLFRLNRVTLNTNFSRCVTGPRLSPISTLSKSRQTVPFLLPQPTGPGPGRGGPRENRSDTKVDTYNLNRGVFKDYFPFKHATVPDFRGNKPTLPETAIPCLQGSLAYLNENSIMTQITVISTKSSLKCVSVDLCLDRPSSNLSFFKSGSNRNTVSFISKKEKRVEWMLINELQKSSHLGTKPRSKIKNQVQDLTLNKRSTIFPSGNLPDFKVGSCTLVKTFTINEDQIHPAGVSFKTPSHVEKEKFTPSKTKFMQKASLYVKKRNVLFCIRRGNTFKNPQLLNNKTLNKKSNSILSHSSLTRNDSDKNKGFLKTKLLRKQGYAKFVDMCLNNGEIRSSSPENLNTVSLKNKQKNQSKEIPASSLGGETITNWHINGSKEILSYTGGGALNTLLKRFNMQMFCHFLFGEIKILQKYYKDYVLDDKDYTLNDLESIKNVHKSYKPGPGPGAADRAADRDEILGDNSSHPYLSAQTNTNTNTKRIANLLSRRIYRSTRRLKIIQLLMRNKRRPEWMMISVLPVLPPDLRPVLQMGENLIVASDLNTLYQRVIYRNNRHYKGRFLDFHFVSSIQRLVQDSVDRLIENGKGGSAPFTTPGGRPLKSLSDILKGKRGRFRFNLLGKRVDFSGRSVIVVSPSLKIHECGLPREIALELYKYFLIRQLLLKKHVSSIVNAKKLIKERKPVVWNVLREIIYYHPLLLNRAPTLHRLGIQAFQPKLTLGSAILLHPLVCTGFNADFDGDQMGVHLPLSPQARAEAWDLLWSRNNLLSPATGHPILLPSQDMVLGFYYMTALLPYNASFRKIKELRQKRNTTLTYSNFVLEKPKFRSPHIQKMRKDFLLSNPTVVRARARRTARRTASIKNKNKNLYNIKDLHNIKVKTVPLSLLKRNAYDSTTYNNQRRAFLNAQHRFLDTQHVFTDQLQVVHAYQKKQIDIHTPIWVKWIGKAENGEKSQTPLEVRVDGFGDNTQIYSTHKYKTKISLCLDNDFSTFTFYIRTTVGRILVNNLIYKH